MDEPLVFFQHANSSVNPSKGTAHKWIPNAAVCRRIQRLVDHLPQDLNGAYDVKDAKNALLSAGIDRPKIDSAFSRFVFSPLGSKTTLQFETSGIFPHQSGSQIEDTGLRNITKEELVAVLQEDFAAHLEHCEYLDGLHDPSENDAGAIGISRVVIDSRIKYLTRSSEQGQANTEQKVLWDAMQLVTIVFAWIVITYYNLTLFGVEPAEFYWCMVASHVGWLSDLLWTLRIPVVDSKGCVAKSSFDIAMVRWRVILPDVIALIPVDLILYWFAETKLPGQALPGDSGHQDPYLTAFVVFRAVKLLKIIRTTTLMTFASLDVVTPRFVTLFFLFRPLLRTSTAVVLSVHTITCLTIILVREDIGGLPRAHYIDQFVETVSLLTGTGPDVPSHGGILERPILLAIMGAGVIAQAAVISNLSITVFRNDVDALNMQEMRETLNIIEHFKVPTDIGTEILSFQLHALNDDVSRRMDVLQTLPIEMQREVLLYVKVAAVNTVRLFTKATHDCKMKIAGLLVQTVVPPMTDIVSIGDIGSEMFLIAHGYATVIISNGMTVAMLSRGDYFGEVALLLPNNVRQATVRALTYCDLWVLDKASFINIVAQFPKLLYAMEEDLRARGLPNSVINDMRAILKVSSATNDEKERQLANKTASQPYVPEVVVSKPSPRSAALNAAARRSGDPQLPVTSQRRTTIGMPGGLLPCVGGEDVKIFRRGSDCETRRAPLFDDVPMHVSVHAAADAEQAAVAAEINDLRFALQEAVDLLSKMTIER